MLGKNAARALAAAWLSMAAATAVAQAQPQIEIDFARFSGTPVPLSPVLTVMAAIALAVAGVLLLRRAARSGKLFGWLLVALAMAAGWRAIDGAPIVSDAAAFVPQIQLTNNPATLLISASGTYTAQNATGGAITLTQVKLNNPGIFFIAIGTTCNVGVILQPLGTCVVVVDNQS